MSHDPPEPSPGFDLGAAIERPPWFDARLSARDFRRLATFIEGAVGIRMPEVKKVMMESRLRPRLKALGLTSFAEYTELVLGPSANEEEVTHLVDQVTTNKTDFFREPDHFDYLTRHAWPTLLRERGAGLTRELVVWSAACSTGEEPYTLAMVLSEAAAAHPGARFRIIASDICTEVLAHAARAVYTEDRVAPVPRAYRAKYLLQSRDRSQPLVRVIPELRARVELHRVNLMDDVYRVAREVDIIFCRNVFIYFDRKDQEQILRRFCTMLAPGGYVFLGHSEAINGYDVPLKAVAATTYRLTAPSS